MARKLSTASDEQIVAELLAAPTYDAAAAALRIDRATIFRRLQEPAFRAKLQAARGQALEAAIAKLHAGASEAVDALRWALSERGTPSVVVQAARVLLDLGFRAHENADLEARIAALEATLQEKAG